MPGKGSNSLDDVFCFDALSHIASVKPFGLGMEMKKIRCTAGAYAWLQENCPDVPIPQLYGFATSDGEIGSLLMSPMCQMR